MPKVDTGFHFRDADMASTYDAAYGRDRRSIAAKQNLERYQLILEGSIVQFEEEEAIALWSALNGANTSHVEMLTILKQSVISELEEYPDLRHKLKDLSVAQWVAVVDACDRVGVEGYHIEDLSTELRRVGLCR